MTAPSTGIRVVVVAIALAVVPVTPALSKSASNDPRAGAALLLRKAIVAANHGELKKSVNLLTHSIRMDKGNPLTYYNRGKVFLKGRVPKQAVRDFNAALRLNPRLSGAFSARARALTRLGRYSDAAKDYARALKLNPRDVQARLNRAVLFLNFGQIEQAIQDFSQILRIDPGMLTALGNRAYLYSQVGQYRAAIKDLARLMCQKPNYLPAMKHLGYVYRQMGKPRLALKWYQAALKLERDNAKRRLLKNEITVLQSVTRKKYSNIK